MIKEMILRRVQARAPDFVIGGNQAPYLRRWWFIPRNPFFNVYVHQFLRSDDDRALHDHPWLFNVSVLLEGSYREWSFVRHFNEMTGENCIDFKDRRAGAVKLRIGGAPHRVELTNGPCWTLFITGPRYREWGFHCPTGWVHWKRFTAQGNPGAIGRGCEQ